MVFNSVGVRFVGQREHNEKEYSYLTDLELKVGDTVVVDSAYGFKTAEVTTLFCNTSEATKWVVCQVDTGAFKVKLEALKKKQLLMQKMTQRLEQVDIVDRFEAAAKNDPAMAELLEAFNATEKVGAITE